MSGRLALQTDFLLPPGKEDVVDKLRLAGSFDLVSGQFRDPKVQEKLGGMSARASGEPGAPPDRVATDFEGRFKLADGTLSLAALKFRIPGAAVHLDGTYGLRSEALAFDGTLRMQATISEAAGGGVRSVLLESRGSVLQEEGRRHGAADQGAGDPRAPEVRAGRRQGADAEVIAEASAFARAPADRRSCGGGWSVGRRQECLPTRNRLPSTRPTRNGASR